MRQISAWVAIAAVPTMIAGIYGMNFEYMPELQQPWGYPAVLPLMVRSAACCSAASSGTAGCSARVRAPAGWGSITDVPGVRVGHAQRVGDGWLTGVTVVLPPPGTVGRGRRARRRARAPTRPTRWTPSTLVPTVDAVTLTGGSAYGLVGRARRAALVRGGTAAGSPSALHDPGSIIVPIVPAAALFDLGRGGDPAARPDADDGTGRSEAAGSADGDASPRCAARVGAGTGARAGRPATQGRRRHRARRAWTAACWSAPSPSVNAAGTPLDAVTGGAARHAVRARRAGRPEPSAATGRCRGRPSGTRRRAPTQHHRSPSSPPTRGSTGPRPGAPTRRRRTTAWPGRSTPGAHPRGRRRRVLAGHRRGAGRGRLGAASRCRPPPRTPSCSRCWTPCWPPPAPAPPGWTCRPTATSTRLALAASPVRTAGPLLLALLLLALRLLAGGALPLLAALLVDHLAVGRAGPRLGRLLRLAGRGRVARRGRRRVPTGAAQQAVQHLASRARHAPACTAPGTRWRRSGWST